MIGSLFAGVDESPGETILYQGRSFKSYRGMGSLSAMSQGSGERYFQSAADLGHGNWHAKAWSSANATGRTAWPSSCPKALRAACLIAGRSRRWCISWSADCAPAWATCGCATIAELQEKAQFVRISGAGLRESHVHDVIITREAPNYHVE